MTEKKKKGLIIGGAAGGGCIALALIIVLIVALSSFFEFRLQTKNEATPDEVARFLASKNALSNNVGFKIDAKITTKNTPSRVTIKEETKLKGTYNLIEDGFSFDYRIELEGGKSLFNKVRVAENLVGISNAAGRNFYNNFKCRSSLVRTFKGKYNTSLIAPWGTDSYVDDPVFFSVIPIYCIYVEQIIDMGIDMLQDYATGDDEDLRVYIDGENVTIIHERSTAVKEKYVIIYDGADFEKMLYELIENYDSDNYTCRFECKVQDVKDIDRPDNAEEYQSPDFDLRNIL